MTVLAEAECEVDLLKPCGDRIICRFVEPEDVTPGGIVLPDQVAQKPMFAKVIAVGPGQFIKFDWGLDEPLIRAPMSCKPGDTICLNQYAGVQIELGEEKIQIIRDEDVMAVIGGCDGEGDDCAG